MKTTNSKVSVDCVMRNKAQQNRDYMLSWDKTTDYGGRLAKAHSLLYTSSHCYKTTDPSSVVRCQSIDDRKAFSRAEKPRYWEKVVRFRSIKKMRHI